MKQFSASELKKLYTPAKHSGGEDNGQITIIGGSKLFHGAPFLAIQSASRIVDMVFFGSPHEPNRDVAANLKARVLGFIWVPFSEVEDYVEKSDAALIGPGFMRARSEKANQTEACDEECRKTKDITKRLLTKFPNKKWVVDAGSLQVMEKSWIPKNAILTPNKKEYKMLFGDADPQTAAEENNCIIVIKGPVSYVYDKDTVYEVKGGNPGLTKGGTGDTMAGLTVGLLAKNEPILAAAAGAFVTKLAGDELYTKKGVYFNADDLSEQIPETLARLVPS
jgi:NAD(P)H-hydrate epimerase